MTSFLRYYKERKLIKVSMIKMKQLIQKESKKDIIAEYVYQRLYTRFLKIFDYSSEIEELYEKDDEKIKRVVFKEEYKNGFLQLAACALLVETFAAFLAGKDETPWKKSPDYFIKVFRYAEDKGNDLKVFKNNNDFYDNIRCGLLHQGETKGGFKITRKGDYLLRDGTIDAFIFHKLLKELLISYKNDLCEKDWNDPLWVKCREKIEYIIKKAI